MLPSYKCRNQGCNNHAQSTGGTCQHCLLLQPLLAGDGPAAQTMQLPSRRLSLSDPGVQEAIAQAKFTCQSCRAPSVVIWNMNPLKQQWECAKCGMPSIAAQNIGKALQQKFGIEQLPVADAPAAAAPPTPMEAEAVIGGCPICYVVMRPEEIQTLHCGHRFHFSCINQTRGNACPLCRGLIMGPVLPPFERINNDLCCLKNWWAPTTASSCMRLNCGTVLGFIPSIIIDFIPGTISMVVNSLNSSNQLLCCVGGLLPLGGQVILTLCIAEGCYNGRNSCAYGAYRRVHSFLCCNR